MKILTTTAIGLGILAGLAQARTTPVQVVPYTPGEVTISIAKQTDTLAFSNGITVEIRPFEVHPSIPTNNCIDGQKALCMVVHDKGRCGIRPEFPQHQLYLGTSQRDTALLAFGLNTDTVWEDAKRVPDMLLDSFSGLPHRRDFFGVPIYYLEAMCTGSPCPAWQGKAPSRSMLMYATRGNASMKLQISQVVFGSNWTECGITATERVWYTHAYFTSATIRWVADSAGNRRFEPSTSAAPRSPGPAMLADGVRIEHSPNRKTVRFALSNSSPTEVTILDSRGIVVARIACQGGSSTPSWVEWDAAARAKPGIYLARITTGTNTVSRSFMIAR